MSVQMLTMLVVVAMDEGKSANHYARKCAWRSR
jgi:hypothetical protein